MAADRDLPFVPSSPSSPGRASGRWGRPKGHHRLGTPPAGPRVLDPCRGPWLRHAVGSRAGDQASPLATDFRPEAWVMPASACQDERPAVRILSATMLALGTGVDEGSVAAVTRVVRMAREAAFWLGTGGGPDSTNP